MRPILLLVAAVAMWPASLWAQQADVMNSGRRVVTAERLKGNERVVLDGVLDEAAWGRATSAGEFTMQDPVLGGTPTERTDIRVVFNQDHLYLGVTNYDSEPDKLLGNTRKRDEFLSADDRFMWTIDTFLNQQTGYFFEMNPAGLMADALMGPGGSNNREWDGIWNARVRQSEIGWVI
ncbi:MAG: putative membrane associated hydrolase, partial [Acidimicrobiaceae bacterium]